MGWAICIVHDYFNFCRKIAPTIFLDAPKGSLIVTEEIFGPLLPIITVKILTGHCSDFSFYCFMEYASYRKKEDSVILNKFQNKKGRSKTISIIKSDATNNNLFSNWAKTAHVIAIWFCNKNTIPKKTPPHMKSWTCLSHGLETNLSRRRTVAKTYKLQIGHRKWLSKMGTLLAGNMTYVERCKHQKIKYLVECMIAFGSFSF